MASTRTSSLEDENIYEEIDSQGDVTSTASERICSETVYVTNVTVGDREEVS